MDFFEVRIFVWFKNMQQFYYAIVGLEYWWIEDLLLLYSAANFQTEKYSHFKKSRFENHCNKSKAYQLNVTKYISLIYN